MRLIDADRLLSDYSYLFLDIYGKECARMFVGIVNQAQTIDVGEELEKIKVEIDNIIYGMEMCDEISAGAYKQITARTERIFDNYIAELKGENNPDCRNCDKWKTCENGEKGHANGTSIGYSIGECRDYVELKGE